MPALLSSLSHLGLAKEVALGVPLAATGWIPILPNGFKPQDVYKYEEDTGYRGKPVQVYGAYQSVTSSTWEMEGDFFPGSGGNLLEAILGGTDTVTGTASPYTHAIATAESAPSYTISDYYVAGARQWPGSRCDRLQLKFNAEAGMSYTAHWIGFPSATYVPEATYTFGTSPYLLGWEAAVSFGGTADANLESFGLDLQRMKSKSLFAAANSQKPYDSFLGPLSGTWQLSFYMGADTEYAYALAQQTQVVVVTVTEPGTGFTLTLTSSAVQFTKPTINRGQDWVVVELEGTAVYNATDAGLLQAGLKNGVADPYSTQASS